jgi:hypothetical protein
MELYYPKYSLIELYYLYQPHVRLQATDGHAPDQGANRRLCNYIARNQELKKAHPNDVGLIYLNQDKLLWG